jgi:S1-C subfamily serine protease
VPGRKWTEIPAAPLGADYAIRTRDSKYVATLNYTGSFPEGTVWTITVQLETYGDALRRARLSQASPKTEATPTSPVPDTADALKQPPGGDVPATPAETKQKLVEEIKAKAETGDVEAEFQLGVCYELGKGVNKDDGEAVKWFRKAAEQNHVPAQYFLGLCYYEGEGVVKDRVEAVKWYRKAAEQNYADAQNKLGLSYVQGQGVAKDSVKAVKWFRKAAEQNYAPAQYNLGKCYWEGVGVAKDQVEAYKWRLLAAGQGDELSKRDMPVVEKQLTREQIAKGRELARSFKPRKVPGAGSDSSSTGIVESRPEGSGTGFFITDDGYLITNEHVAGDGAQVRLLTATGIILAKVVKMDATNDLALLKAEGKFAALPVATSRPVKLGDTVATVGFPNVDLQGFAPKFARGEIASLSGPQDDARFFQISVPVQPGNSGGALVDERGNVVGVVSAKLSAEEALRASGWLPENVNYAVKSSFLLGFLESVPEVAAKLKEPNSKDMKFADVVEQAKEAAVLVLVY